MLASEPVGHEVLKVASMISHVDKVASVLLAKVPTKPPIAAPALDEEEVNVPP